MAAVVYIRTELGEQLRDLSRALRTHGEKKTLRRNLHKNIRREAKPTERDIKSAVLRARVRGDANGQSTIPTQPKHLRQRVAAAVNTRVTPTSIRIEVSPRKFDGPNALPKYLAGAELQHYRRWRHPLFGNRNHWFGQTAVTPWFYAQANKHSRDFRRAVFEAIRETNRAITK